MKNKEDLIILVNKIWYEQYLLLSSVDNNKYIYDLIKELRLISYQIEEGYVLNYNYLYWLLMTIKSELPKLNYTLLNKINGKTFNEWLNYYGK